MNTHIEGRRTEVASAPPLVLIADGHDDTRELYAVSLTSFGFRTITVDDGALLVARASEAHPDIIVTDIALRRQDGWNHVGQLKDDARTRNIPIVVLTGYTEPSMRERASREGCAAFLLKPYLPEELARTLRELLGRSV